MCPKAGTGRRLTDPDWYVKVRLRCRQLLRMHTRVKRAAKMVRHVADMEPTTARINC